MARTHWGKKIWSSLNSLYNYKALISNSRKIGQILIYDPAELGSSTKDQQFNTKLVELPQWHAHFFNKQQINNTNVEQKAHLMYSIRPLAFKYI